MSGHSEPTSFEGGRLTVTVRSPAWASRLRQQEAGLVRSLRADPAFRVLRDIRVRIEPTDPIVKPAPAPARGPSRLSSQAARLVRSVAETVSDPQ
ncbi:MAG TPA: DciA family protein, partial [Burkholderiales bacterium]|nr:DciA family protein [Burkholderiales bacterium]